MATYTPMTEKNPGDIVRAAQDWNPMVKNLTALNEQHANAQLVRLANDISLPTSMLDLPATVTITPKTDTLLIMLTAIILPSGTLTVGYNVTESGGSAGDDQLLLNAYVGGNTFMLMDTVNVTPNVQVAVTLRGFDPTNAASMLAQGFGLLVKDFGEMN